MHLSHHMNRNKRINAPELSQRAPGWEQLRVFTPEPQVKSSERAGIPGKDEHQESRNSGIREFRNSGFRNSGIWKYRNSGIQYFRNSVFQEFGISGFQDVLVFIEHISPSVPCPGSCSAQSEIKIQIGDQF